MSYTVAPRKPTAEEHRRLSESVGWADAFWWEAMPASLVGSTCGVVVRHDSSGEVVGMGRVVGDGAFYFYIQDVAVHPDHQGRGLGRAIVNELVDQIRHQAPGHCFVGLFATPAAEALYRTLGGGNRRWWACGRSSGTNADNRWSAGVPRHGVGSLALLACRTRGPSLGLTTTGGRTTPSTPTRRPP